MMYILIVASLMILVAYLAFAIIKTGWPYSISETYYRLKANGYKEGLFTLTITAVALTALVPLVEVTPEKWKFLAFLMCAGLLFVAFAPQFARQLDNRVHYIATAISALSALAWTLVCFKFSWITPIIAICAIIYPVVKSPQKWLFWVEVAVLASVYVNAGVLLIKIL